MIPADLIRRKQQGQAHSPEEIAAIVAGFSTGSMADYQLAAWLMAVYFKGLTEGERTALVQSMIDSGRRLDFSHLDGYVADKHSTGGVGDKVSLVLAPLVAACGVYVPMISGRGLGHTGGTLDKLESIPGFNTGLDLDTFGRLVAEVGCAIIGQTDEICPADRKMYALRDVTSTVSSIPLICGSIMSKKIAEGIRGLVLDVKVGNGAFMETADDARQLADILVATGEAFGVQTVARLTDMSQPLGRSAGIWCEVLEAVSVLEGEGPEDLTGLCTTLSADILTLAGHDDPVAAIAEALSSGRAREKLDQMVAAQGGDAAALARPETHQPAVTIPLKAPLAGYLTGVDTYAAGMSLTTAGAGRRETGDRLDPSAGFALYIKIGDAVEEGDDIGRYFGSDEGQVKAAAAALSAALTFGDVQAPPSPLIVG